MPGKVNQHLIARLHLLAQLFERLHDVLAGRLRIAKFDDIALVDCHGARHLARVVHVFGHAQQGRGARGGRILADANDQGMPPRCSQAGQVQQAQ